MTTNPSASASSAPPTPPDAWREAAARCSAGTLRLGPSSWRINVDGLDLVVRRLPGLAGTGGADSLRQLVSGAACLPGVVVPRVIFEDDDSVVVLRAWVEGARIDEVTSSVGVADRPRLSAELADRLDQLERTLVEASCRHGGITAANVLVRPDGGLALVDIGLGAVSEGAGQEDLSRVDAEGFARLRRSLGATRPRQRRRTQRRRHGMGSAIPAALAVLAVLIVFGIRNRGPGPPPLCGPRSMAAVTVPGLSQNCLALVSWSSGVGRLVWAGHAVTFTVGRPGDVLLVGRWMCGTAQLPAVYRPSTGRLWVFPAWPTAGAVRSLPARLVGSEADGGGERPVRVVRAGRCDKVQVG